MFYFLKWSVLFVCVFLFLFLFCQGQEGGAKRIWDQILYQIYTHKAKVWVGRLKSEGAVCVCVVWGRSDLGNEGSNIQVCGWLPGRKT